MFILDCLLATGSGVAIEYPFSASDTAAAIAVAGGTVLALTFGWRIGFMLVKTTIRRLAGSAK